MSTSREWRTKLRQAYERRKEPLDRKGLHFLLRETSEAVERIRRQVSAGMELAEAGNHAAVDVQSDDSV